MGTSYLHTGYRPEIDGLRAVAILAVVFFHAGIGFRGGYVGVDVFFVISGYLITGLIIRELDAGQFRLSIFWERRVRRILPALVVVLVAILLGGWFLFTPRAFKELGQSVSAQAMVAANFFFWFKSWVGSGYFEGSTEMKPLLHTWSLALEEQFYFFLPMLLVWCGRRSRATLAQALFGLVCASFGLSVYCSYFHSSANFYLLPMRAWELLIGALLAVAPMRSKSSSDGDEFLSWTGFLLICGAVVFYDRDTRFPGVSALAPCLGAALIIWANSRSLTSLGRILASRPCVFIGLISYSLYLWHWPVLVFSKHLAVGPLSQNDRLLALVASLVLAVISWRYVEMPFRRRSIFASRPLLFGIAGGSTALLLFAGLAIHWFKGFPLRHSPDALQFANGEMDRGAFITSLPLESAQRGDLIELGAGDKHRAIELLVWGDSHAMAVMPVLDALCREHSIRGVAATQSAKPPLVDYRRQGGATSNGGRMVAEQEAFNRAVLDFVHGRRVGNVLLIACWGGYLRDGDGYYRDGEAERLHQDLLKTIALLEAAGAKVWIMQQVPRPGVNVPQLLTTAAIMGRDPEALGLPLADHREALRLQGPIFDGVTNSFPEVTILDPTGHFLDRRGQYRIAMAGRSLYWDDHHLSVTGAMLLRPLFEPLFNGIRPSLPAASNQSPSN